MRHTKHFVCHSNSPSKASAGVKISDLSMWLQERHGAFERNPGKRNKNDLRSRKCEQ